MRYYISHYSQYIYDLPRYEKTIERVCRIVETLKRDNGVDAIAFRGSSGASLAFPIYLMTGIPLLHSRKPGSHSCYKLEGSTIATRYCIVDECVSSGQTIVDIVNDIEESYKGMEKPIPVLTDIILVDTWVDDLGPKNALNLKLPGHSIKFHQFQEL